MGASVAAAAAGEERCKCLGQRCSRWLKKQRAKFYILRRCIAMLLCWHEDPA